MRAIADIFNVSVSFVHYVIDLHRKYGQITDPYAQPWQGRSLNIDHWSWRLHSKSQRFKTIYLLGQNSRGSHHCTGGLCVSLNNLTNSHLDGVFKKSLARRAAECNEELQTLWELEVAELDDPDLFVFVHKSAIDNWTVQCFSGWSILGGHSTSCCAFFRGKCHSILPALSSDGIIALDIFEGSVNKEWFLQFLYEQVVCSCSSVMSVGCWYQM